MKTMQEPEKLKVINGIVVGEPAAVARALATGEPAGPLGALGVARGWGSGGEPSSAEAYFQDRDAFVRYVEDEVNPARAAEGLSTCDLRAAAHLYEVISSRRYRQPSGKTPNAPAEPTSGTEK